jgi:hypothetical protein
MRKMVFTFCGGTEPDGIEAAGSFPLGIGVGTADVRVGATGAGDGAAWATDGSGS